MLGKYVKRSVYNTFCYAAASAIARGINFLFFPYFLSRLSLYELGIWDWYQTGFSVGVFFLSSCAATCLIRFSLLYKDDLYRRTEAIGNALLFALFGVSLVCITAGISIITGIWHIKIFELYTLLNIVLYVFFALSTAYLSMREYLVFYSVAFIAQSALSALCTVYAVSKGYGIVAFFWGNTISLLPFFVSFAYLFIRYQVYDWHLFIQQIRYAGPLLFNGLLYTLLLSNDRWFLQKNCGFEALGEYGLLWRFGAIFQILTLSVTSAWPIVCFNAQKEPDGDNLVKKIVVYFSLLLATGYVVACVGAKAALGLFLPSKYYYLAIYFPTFFIPILLLALAHLYTVGCALACKSNVLIFTMLLGFFFQIIFLWWGASSGVWGICIANIVAFFLYVLFNAYASALTHPIRIIDTKKLVPFFLQFTIFSGCMQAAFLIDAPWYVLSLFIPAWLALVFISGIVNHEICLVYSYARSFYLRIFRYGSHLS